MYSDREIAEQAVAIGCLCLVASFTCAWGIGTRGWSAHTLWVAVAIPFVACLPDLWYELRELRDRWRR